MKKPSVGKKLYLHSVDGVHSNAELALELILMQPSAKGIYELYPHLSISLTLTDISMLNTYVFKILCMTVICILSIRRGTRPTIGVGSRGPAMRSHFSVPFLLLWLFSFVCTFSLFQFAHCTAH